jgi:hypothetical protein
MLAWMSETGSGDIPELRQRLAWLARTADLILNPKPYETGRWLRDMSSLAHAEFDWPRGRWAVTPAAAALLPASGGTAVLTGRRQLGLLERLEAVLSVQVESSTQDDNERLTAPTQIYVQADSIAELKEALSEIGVRYVGRAAEHIARRLPPLQLGSPAAPPAWGSATEYAKLGDNIRFIKGSLSGDGLCRVTVQGRPNYVFRSGSSWFHTDHAHGILWGLAELGIGVFRWRRERTSDDVDIGTVFIDQGAPLPPLQARALVLCSGLPTAFGDKAGTAIYRNVPKTVAELVATSVRQQLATIN